jgi:hypothetical protein
MMNLFKQYAVRDPEAAARMIQLFPPEGPSVGGGARRGGRTAMSLRVFALTCGHLTPRIVFAHDPEFRAAIPQAPTALA